MKIPFPTGKSWSTKHPSASRLCGQPIRKIIGIFQKSFDIEPVLISDELDKQTYLQFPDETLLRLNADLGGNLRIGIPWWTIFATGPSSRHDPPKVNHYLFENMRREVVKVFAPVDPGMAAVGFMQH
jgi:hypothetical protein